jgi:hypothetical protein
MFIICLRVIAGYSAQLEPITNQLQQQDLDLHSALKHIKYLKEKVQVHRENAIQEFSSIFELAELDADELDVELTCPRLAKRQKHRANTPADTPEEYFRRTVFVPYLDSLIAAFENRFSEKNSGAFDLFFLHPKNFKTLSIAEYMEIAKNIHNMYGNLLDNFLAEARCWYEFWNISTNTINAGSLDFVELLKHADTFYPSVHDALCICLSLPVTTCTIERSFSTLRRVKTWLRSTMSDERLSALCMMSVHKERIQKLKTDFVEEVVKRFSIQDRKI